MRRRIIVAAITIATLAGGAAVANATTGPASHSAAAPSTWFRG